MYLFAAVVSASLAASAVVSPPAAGAALVSSGLEESGFSVSSPS